ncbi:MAG: glycosyltransferase family 4 protein [Moorea sp. SIO4A1]|nr:glycosyltransferase family 4 protein [Moorena sp. SIO4A1]
MHYAVPRLLYQAKLLEYFYTDICATKGWPRLLHAIPSPLQPAGVKRLLGRVPTGIPRERIIAFNHLGWTYAQKLRQARTTDETTAAFLWSGKAFCQLVLQHGLKPATGIYTFNSAGLEILQAARYQGMDTVMEQTIAPRALEQELLLEEQENFPGWETPLGKDTHLEEYTLREQKEWEQADTIICGSEFVRQGIIACGGSGDRCKVIPYGIDMLSFPKLKRHRQTEPLRVLTVGSVGLRKGSPYVLKAAQKLRGKAVFRMVGPIGVQTEAQSLLSKNVELIGPIPRSEILAQYAWADIFLLPSLCEGSATVIYEALATGLPVICTPNAGSVVRDGYEGFIVSIRDVEAIVDKVELLASNPELRAEMSDLAIQRAKEFTLESYHRRLMNVLVS